MMQTAKIDSGANLTATGLSIGYPGVSVGRDLSLQVQPGAVTMLLGPNGCGKSTLLKTILGLLPPQAGEVRIGAQPVQRFSRRALARELAYVPQSADGYFAFNVFDIVLMGRAPHLGMFAVPGAADRQAAQRALDAIGIDDLAERPFTAISGGQQQLVLIARAMAQGARVLIMDEPTASLDYANQHRVLRHIRQVAGEGRGILVSSHNPDHALQIADHVILMRDGHILAQGMPGEVMTSDALTALYGIAMSVVTVDSGGTRRQVCLAED